MRDALQRLVRRARLHGDREQEACARRDDESLRRAYHRAAAVVSRSGRSGVGSRIADSHTNTLAQLQARPSRGGVICGGVFPIRGVSAT